MLSFSAFVGCAVLCWAVGLFCFGNGIHKPIRWGELHICQRSSHCFLPQHSGAHPGPSRLWGQRRQRRGQLPERQRGGQSDNVHLNNPSVAWDSTINTLSAFSSVPFLGKLGYLDVLFGVGSILTTYYKPSAEDHPVSYSDGAWNDPWSTGQGSGLRSKYRMFPRLRVRYKRSYSLFDNYDAAGFQSETLTFLDKFVQNDSSFGYFQYVP